MARNIVDAGILREGLGAYLARAEAGEIITVIDDGRAVAILAPVALGTATALWRLVAEGSATWTGGKPGPPDSSVAHHGDVVQAPIDEREDRVL